MAPIQEMQKPLPNWSFKNILMMVCLLQETTSGIRDSSTLRRSLITQIIPITGSISTSSSLRNNLFFWSQEEKMILMKWMKLRELECQIIQTFQKIETFMVSLDGFLISTLNARRITMWDIQRIENFLMDQWIIMWLSITQQWLIQNFSDKTLHQNLLPGREFRQWAYKINQNMDQRWDRLSQLSRPHYTPPHSFWIEMFQINIRLMIRFKRLRNIPMLSLFWDNLRLNGIKLRKDLRLIEISHTMEWTHSQMASTSHR